MQQKIVVYETNDRGLLIVLIKYFKHINDLGTSTGKPRVINVWHNEK